MTRIYLDLRASTALKVLLAGAMAAVIGGCGATSDSGQKIAGDSLSVFSGLPLSGALEPTAADMVKAEKLALRQGKARAGDFTLNYISLNDADLKGPTRELVAQGARHVAREGKAVAYIGGLTSADSATALPILNQDDILMVSPTSSAVGLTKVFPGARPEEPDSYYVSGRRNFVRIAPTDDVVADAAAALAKKLKVERILIVSDGTTYGKGMAKQFSSEAKELGLTVNTANRRVPKPNQNGSSSLDASKPLALELGSKEPDAVFFAGQAAPSAARALDGAFRGASDKVKLIALAGQDGLMERSFYGKLGAAGSDAYLVSSLLDPKQLLPKGRKFLSDYRRQFEESPDRHAVYAYTAMELIKRAVKRAGPDAADRLKLIDEVFATRDYSSPVGKISVDENGDSGLKAVSSYRISESRPVFFKGLSG